MAVPLMRLKLSVVVLLLTIVPIRSLWVLLIVINGPSIMAVPAVNMAGQSAVGRFPLPVRVQPVAQQEMQ